MKGLDALLAPTISQGNLQDYMAYPLFDYHAMHKQDSLMATISQYPPELLAILGTLNISDTEGKTMMQYISANKACAGSDGSVKDGIGGHSFCITDNYFTHQIWGHATTVGTFSEMSSLRAEHGGALAILLVLYALQLHFPTFPLPANLDIWIDNSEVVRRGKTSLPKMGIKQQLILDHDLWATTQRLSQEIQCAIRWK